MKEIEQAVLFSAMTKKNCLYDLMEYDDKIFQDLNHKKIYEVLCDMFNANKDICLTSVNATMIDCGMEREYLNLVSDSATVPIIYDMKGILEKLKEHADKEKIKLLAKDIYFLAKSGDIKYEEFIDKIYEIKNERFNHGVGNIDFSKLKDRNIDDIFERNHYIQTGFKSIDTMLHGFFGGQTYIIAARPGMGKTAIAMQMAKQMETDILFFSLEMRWTELYARFLSSNSEVAAWKIEAKKMTDMEFERVIKAHSADKQRIIVFDEHYNLMGIISTIRKMYSMGKCKCVIIDYVQLIGGADGENQNIKMSTISRTLKNTAMSLNIPIIFLSQLNRNVERMKTEPTLADLRDSGSLEQDASGVIFLHRKDKDEPLKIILAKNRKGKHGTIDKINFEGEFVRFYDDNETPSNPEWFND